MKKLIRKIVNSDDIPDPVLYMEKLEKTRSVFLQEVKPVRPTQDSGEPGGIIYLLPRIPTIIVPDLHARKKFIGSLVNLESDDGDFFTLMAQKKLQVVCVGDGFHKELDGKERWISAFSEYEKNFRKHKAMDEEMSDSLGLMELIMELKCAFPRNFHFLKGNHENIANEEGGGNHPFRKFALEGDMVKTWVLQFLGKDFLEAYSQFEKSLPLLAVGDNFLISHAEPLRFFNREEVFTYNSEAVHGLTWTANGEAVDGSVKKMLDYYLSRESRADALYFGGHRIISDKYRLRAHGEYVQIHNPWKFQVVLLKPENPMDPEKNIIELPGNK